MKRFLLALSITFLAILLVACSSDENESGDNSDSEEITIGASLLTNSHPFQVGISEALEAEANEQGVELITSIANQDLNTQLSDVEDFINQQVDAILIVPVDSDGVKGAITKAEDAGIPVITLDVPANGVEVASHIATDNYTGGKMAAEAMAQLLDEQGEIGLITYPEVQSVRDRIEGFKDHSENYDGMEIVVELPGRTREEAKSASEDMLTSNPDLDGIFGFGDDMAISASNTVEETNSEALVVGFDGLEEARNKVDEDNPFKVVIVQDPEQMGVTGIETAIKVVNGEEVDSEYPISPGIYVEGQEYLDVTFDGDSFDFSIE